MKHILTDSELQKYKDEIRNLQKFRDKLNDGAICYTINDGDFNHFTTGVYFSRIEYLNETKALEIMKKDILVIKKESEQLKKESRDKSNEIDLLKNKIIHLKNIKINNKWYNKIFKL